MKKWFMLLGILLLFLFVYNITKTHFDIPSSLASGEVAITFLDKDVLLCSSSSNHFLLKLDDDIDVDIYIQKYHLRDIAVYTKETVKSMEGISIWIDNDVIHIDSGDQSFCITGSADCEFTYIYQNDGYLEGEVFFYNDITKDYVDDVVVSKYNVTQNVLTLVFDMESYMVIEH